jgi:two-component system phosphate regulon response regulator OmpR
MPPSYPHILVVDDDTRIRELLSRYLRDNGFYVTTAKDAAEARLRMEDFVFDLMVLDVMMPGETGTAFATNLRTHSDLPILMLTAMGEAEDRISGLESGVDDYLTKPFEPRELLLRIRTILKRSQSKKMEYHTIPIGALRFNPDTNQLIQGNDTIYLTQSEASLLAILAAHIGKTVTREMLAEHMGLTINERTIDVQITRLRQKIEPDPKQPRYLQTTRGVGYTLYSY